MEAFLDSHPAAIVAAGTVAAAALAFLLKLGQDFLADKSRQAASLRIVTVYIRLAMEGWDVPGFVVDPAAPAGRSIAGLSRTIAKIRNPEPYTPFVPFSPHDNLTVFEVRDFLGFLDSEEIESAVRFIQADAMTHALADDLRSEYVRREFTPERKITLIRQYSEEVVAAYEAAEEALEILGPRERCLLRFWFLPFGYRFWQFGVWLWKREEPRPC